MPSVSLTYELVIFDNALSPILTVTSQRGGTNPFIAEPPSGDGLEFDPVTGSLRTGAYTIQITDPITTGTSRLVTSVLADADLRNQLLSRSARVRQSTDGGATWSVLMRGYVLSVRLTDAITWSITIGDTRRIEQTNVVFARDDATYFPIRGARFGGPVVGGAVGPVPERRGGMFIVREVSGSNVGMDFLSGFDPLGRQTQFFGQFVEGIGPITRVNPLPPLAPYNQSPTTTTLDNPEGASRINQWAEPYYVYDENTAYRYRFPLLRYRVAAFLTGAPVGAFTPLVPPLRLLYGGPTLTGTGVANNRHLHMEWTGSLPSVGAAYWVSLITDQATPECPLYVSDHPVFIVRKLYEQAGIPVNATSFTDLANLQGGDLRVTLRIDAPQTMLAFMESALLGPFGIGIRNNSAGEIEAFNARIKTTAVPSVTINTSDLIDEVAPVFELDEGSVVNRVVLDSLNLVPVLNGPRSLSTEDVQSLPRNGFWVARDTKFWSPEVPDTTTYGTREIKYTVPGMIHTITTFTPQTDAFLRSLAFEVYDRYGRGMQAADLRVRRGAGADGVLVGDEIYVQPAHLPNKNKRYGDDPSVGARIMQVVRRTETPDAIELRCLDSGTNAQPTNAPTISVAASVVSPSTVAVYTITNAATLNATVTQSVAVEWAVSATTPTTSGAVAGQFEAPDIPTGGVALPPVSPGSIVWVRARTEQFDRRPSAWTAWTSVTLGALAAPSSLAVGSITASSAELTWTNTSSTQRLRVWVAPSAASDTAAAQWIIADLPAGSTRITAANLSGPSVAYTARVAYLSDEGALGTAAVATFSTATNTLTAPRPAGLQTLTGTDAGKVAAYTSGCAVAVWAADTAMALVVERAPDVTGSAGTYAEIDLVPGTTSVYVDPQPNNGAAYWYRFKHRASGYTDSSATCGARAVVSGIPPGLRRPDLVVPSVRAENSESGTTGTVTLEIADTQCRVVQVRFRHRVQPAAWSAWTVDTTAPYSYSQTIPTTGFLEIEWEVSGYDGTGALVVLATAIEYFDIDTRPDLVSVVGTFTQNGAIVLAFSADTDAASLRYAVSTSSQPDLATTQAGTLINARNGTATLTGPYAYGSTVYVSVLAYAGASGTGVESSLYEYRFVRDGEDIRITETASETATTGTLALTILDPQTRVTLVEARTQVGHAAFGSYAALTNTGTATAKAYSVSVTLVEKVPSKIEYRVTATTPTGGSTIYATNVVTFAMGSQPFPPDIIPAVREDGTVDVRVIGDVDTASLRLGFSTTSAAAADTNAASATPVNARANNYSNVGTLTLGQKGFISVLAYSAASGGGEVSQTARAEVVRSNVQSSRTVRWNPSGAFHPQFSTTPHTRSPDGYAPIYNSTGFASHYATLPIPVGATLTGVSVRCYLLAASGSNIDIDMYLWRLEGDGTQTLLGTVQSATTSTALTTTLAVTSLSESVSASRSYVVEIVADSNDVNDVAVLYFADVSYLSPDLTVNL